jgi:cob(I)alamin adenosyltransferase
MKIYTKTGDNGDTSLLGGQRVPKSSLRIETFGTVDELNSQIGIVRALKPTLEIDDLLGQIQAQLFCLGADLAGPSDDKKTSTDRIQNNDIIILEKSIDRFEEQLQTLGSFILPGGSLAGAHLHMARAVCRRAERLVDSLVRKEKTGNLQLVYLNRLSDLLFVLSRYSNKISGVADVKWKGSSK